MHRSIPALWRHRCDHRFHWRGDYLHGVLFIHGQGKPDLKVTYKMNNEELDTFYPTHTCIDGRYILTLFLPIPQVVANSENTLAVLLEMSSGSASIGEAQIRATVSGQGLVAGLGEWNGRCNFTDHISRIEIPDAEFGIFGLEDELVVEFPIHEPYVIQQNIGRIVFPIRPLDMIC